MKRLSLFFFLLVLFASCKQNASEIAFCEELSYIYAKSDGYSVDISNFNNFYDGNERTCADLCLHSNEESCFFNLYTIFANQFISKIYLKIEDLGLSDKDEFIIQYIEFGKKYPLCKFQKKQSANLLDGVFFDVNKDCSQIQLYFSNNYDKKGDRNIKLYEIKIYNKNGEAIFIHS